eukprot:CAMPEP_0184857318 /NCGR_PEP_ID=MMETSP0580-20130426/2479_1 /TAXON_ID=1118495 /ORGANISM="Dactyliosolen fragilissimus" /LENGTH=231 /DNA_ID=CAMNT_0027352845 /DNA_START=398 /DNA_END=1093 /DNA_ORIENTATION=+
MLATAGAIGLFQSIPIVSHAACLQGDTSPSCIGVYKLPMDDAVRSYVESPEQLAKYAPDLKWVPPVTYPTNPRLAWEELKQLYKGNNNDAQNNDDTEEEALLDNLRSLITSGDLSGAGVKILTVVPRITVAGRVVIRALNDATVNNGDTQNEISTPSSTSFGDLSLKAYRMEVAHAELLADLGQMDIMLGQAIKGQMGAITFAQIQILDILKDVEKDFSDMMKAIPVDFKF